LKAGGRRDTIKNRRAISSVGQDTANPSGGNSNHLQSGDPVGAACLTAVRPNKELAFVSKHWQSLPEILRIAIIGMIKSVI
jgi:hypothetical protein